MKEIPVTNCTRVDHVGIVVKDLAALVKWYEETLGLHSKDMEVVQEQRVTVAFLLCGNSELELLESTPPEGPIVRFIEKNGENIQHIAIRVDDIDAALAELKEKGVRPIGQTPRHGVDGTRIAFLHPKATHDVLLELCERK